MRCPSCGEKTEVYNSRNIAEGFAVIGPEVWRRRRCPNGHRFSTRERIEEFTEHELKQQRDRARAIAHQRRQERAHRSEDAHRSKDAHH